ncbi:AT-rich interactive domain-containing protein 5B isoform X1 [Larimichthys crocea]|uniref:AT-rich interactive domain-containing protein 5B isoform X1 n=1 Tax=Larimichthys crocea TaxID=215358 RepID=UPI00054C5861|nr:AT-rich interactive domain-containing protein 5B isoform X1 [Larimichthys crocea]
MEPGSLTWLGSPCGSHGPYVFYKAFRFNLDGKKRLLSLGEFFLVRCQPDEPLCVAELQLLWEEMTNHQLLSSSKLYFLPEDTPQGRSASHGQDEVIAVSEKVVVRLEDLVKWTVWDHEAWNRGMKALPLKISSKRSMTDSFIHYHDPTLNGGLHFKDVMKEKAALGEGLGQKQVLVLSYPRYCRYRSVVARLREQPRSLLTNEVVLALGGIAVPSENTHILYCRDTFRHPTLLHNESICDEFAPNLKGRPRKKKLSNYLYRDSHGQSQGSGHCQKSSKETEARAGETTVEVTADKAGVTKVKDSRVSSVNHSTPLALPEERRRRGRGLQYKAEEQAFLVSLYKYMKERKTPIERIPYLGFKQINLWTMFQAAQSLGGYELITARRQWKNVYDELGGNPGSTSAATCTRRHYERLILPYERFIRGEEDKPAPQLKPGKLEASTSKESSSSICTPILKTEACPEKSDTLESRDPDQSRLVLEQNSQLKLEPQICITRLDSLKPLLSVRKRQSPTQDSQNDPAIQLMQKHKEEVKRKRRYSGCDPSYLTTCPMTKDESMLPLATPKIFNHGHSAVDLWQHQQVPLQDLCRIGKPRNLQSPTIPEPPSEQAELPRTEDTSSGFTTLFESSGASKAIMSPLAKKKLLLHVSSTGLPKQGHCYSNFRQTPPLITSSSTNCIIEEPAERPAVGTDSSVVVLSRPSVIQHVQSFKTTFQKDRARQVKESTPLPLNSHKHHFHLVPPSYSPIPLLSHQKESKCPSTPLLTPKMPKSRWTPQGFPVDLFSSVSYLDYRHRAAEKADGTVNVELVYDGSKQPQEQGATLPRDPKSLVRFLQPDDDSKYSTPTDQGNSPNPRTLLSDDQPTDLSLPKSSLKPLHHPCPSGPLKYSTRYQDSTPIVPQNGLTDVTIAHYLRAQRVPPLSVSLAHTCNPRQDPAAEPFRATEEAVVGTVHNGGVVKKQKVEDKKVQERLQTALYNRMTESLGSQMVLHNACVAHPLNNLGKSISKSRRQAFPKDVLSSSPSKEIKTPKDDSVVGESAEEAEGGKPASPFSILNPASQIYPNILNPSGTLALYQVQNLCRDTFSIPLIMDQPHCSKSHLQNPLQYLKTQSTDFDSSLVPPIAIHSSIAQRQLLVQASASPIHIYQQTYGDVLHHKLYPVSVNPHPTFSQAPSVHPSTKLP